MKKNNKERSEDLLTEEQITEISANMLKAGIALGPSRIQKVFRIEYSRATAIFKQVVGKIKEGDRPQPSWEWTPEAVRGVMSDIEKMIRDITYSPEQEVRTSSMMEIVKSSMEKIDRLYARKERITGIHTGFDELDARIGGLQKSDLIVIAGRPWMGKSALVISILEHVGLVEEAHCAFFSLELSREELGQRMLCSISEVDGARVRTGFLGKEDWRKLVGAANKLSETPIWIDDTASISTLELRAKARRLKTRHNIQLIVIDFLQLMCASKMVISRIEELREISRSLKALARELNVPVIVTSQLSRAADRRTDHRPELSDIRGASVIEQYADVVMLLTREEYYNPTEENKGMAELIIAKNRTGPTGGVKLKFLPEYTKFVNPGRNTAK